MDKSNKANAKVIAGFLTLALDIEDQMSIAVYGEYLDKKIWPAILEKETFQIIKDNLMILIQETEEHKKTFLSLKNKLNNKNASD